MIRRITIRNSPLRTVLYGTYCHHPFGKQLQVSWCGSHFHGATLEQCFSDLLHGGYYGFPCPSYLWVKSIKVEVENIGA